jgi:hypothetical protein
MSASKLERFEPELAGLVFTLCMHVRRFVAVGAREEKSLGSWDSLDSRPSDAQLPQANLKTVEQPPYDIPYLRPKHRPNERALIRRALKRPSLQPVGIVSRPMPLGKGLAAGGPGRNRCARGYAARAS